MTRFAAVILAGGAGRRLGGIDKATIPVRGAPMLDHVLNAVADAHPCVVVGPPRSGLPEGVISVREQPPGGGPVAAAAAGMAALAAALHIPPAPGADASTLVALLAADLPLLTAEALAVLRAHLPSPDEVVPGGSGAVGLPLDGAVFVDEAGRRQSLCGVWRRSTLVRRLAGVDNPTGRSIRELFAGVRVAEVLWRTPDRTALPPWFDCDTDDDLRFAERRAT